jgi:hypothetical protein
MGGSFRVVSERKNVNTLERHAERSRSISTEQVKVSKHVKQYRVKQIFKQLLCCSFTKEPAVMNRNAIIKGLLLFSLAVTNIGCLTYTHRVSYSARTNSSVTNPSTNSATVFVLANLSKQPTAGALPFVFLLKEKGLYGFSVQLFGASTRVYQRGIIQAVSIDTPERIVFQSRDSTFVQYVPSTPYLGTDKSDHKQFNSFYQSPYIIAGADSSSQLSFTLDYTLITREGKRESHRLHQPLIIDHEKGFSLSSF